MEPMQRAGDLDTPPLNPLPQGEGKSLRNKVTAITVFYLYPDYAIG